MKEYVTHNYKKYREVRHKDLIGDLRGRGGDISQPNFMVQFVRAVEH